MVVDACMYVHAYSPINPRRRRRHHRSGRETETERERINVCKREREANDERGPVSCALCYVNMSKHFACMHVLVYVWGGDGMDGWLGGWRAEGQPILVGPANCFDFDRRRLRR